MLLEAGGLLPFDFPQYMKEEYRQLPPLGREVGQCVPIIQGCSITPEESVNFLCPLQHVPERGKNSPSSLEFHKGKYSV